MRDLPTGTVTFLFSDIEGSTRMLRELGRDAYGELQDAHARVMRAAIAAGDGVEIRTEGDAFFVVFPSAIGAVRAAAEAQRGLGSHPWPDGRTIRVRIGVHTGEATLGGDDYLGLDVNRAARIAAVGHGGQVVLSASTASLVAVDPPGGVSVRALGTFTLKDFDEPQPLHDLVIDGLDTTFPPLRTAARARVELPTSRTSFVGRDEAIAAIARSLDDARLTTLTGPGGTGKTRLAVEVARATAHRFPDGVGFVDLSTTTDPEVIVPTIGRVLRARETVGHPLAAVAEQLRDRRVLLILDNLEQVVHGAGVIGEVLDAAPTLTVLATSRIPLRLSGEAEYSVPPLALPAADVRGPEALEASDAIRLFVERAGDARPGFTLDPTNVDAVVEIVRRLDALPLAIELAASRLRLFDAETLAARLDHRLAVLTGGPRDAPARHRTLEASIRWSDESLDRDARILFARLAVFAGGWTLEAAERVCGDDLDVLAGLEALLDSSLVRRSGDDEPDLRFRMLETIREYALDRFATLPDAERRDLERRHTAFVHELAAAAEPHLTAHDQTDWLDRLDREHDNVRAVLDRAERDAEHVRPALETAASIWRFWQQRGHLTEARARLQRVLALPAAEPRDAARARALGALGSIEYWLTDYEAMRPRYDEAAAIAEEVGDARLLARALFDRSFIWLVTDELASSLATLERCLEITPADDLVLRAKTMMSIGYARMLQGDPAGTIELLDQAIELNRSAGERLALCEGLVARASIHVLGAGPDGGGLDDAVADVIEATALAAETPGPIMLAQVVMPQAIVASKRQRFGRAAILMGAWESLQVDHGVHFPDVGLSYFGDPAEASRAALGPHRYADAFATGRTMTIDAMVALLLDPDAGDDA